MSDYRRQNTPRDSGRCTQSGSAASVTGLAGCFPSVGGHWAPGLRGPGLLGANANLPIPQAGHAHRWSQVLNQNSVNASSIIQPEVVAQMLDAGLTALGPEGRAVQRTLPPVDAGALTPRTRMAAPMTAMQGRWGAGSDPDNPWRVLLPKYPPWHAHRAQGQLPQSMGGPASAGPGACHRG